MSDVVNMEGDPIKPEEIPADFAHWVAVVNATLLQINIAMEAQITLNEKLLGSVQMQKLQVDLLQQQVARLRRRKWWRQ